MRSERPRAPAKAFVKGRRPSAWSAVRGLRGGETEAHAGLGDDVAGPAGVRLYLLAQVAHVHAQRLRVLDPFGSPEWVEDHLLRHHEPGVPRQIGEDVELRWREGDLLAGPRDPASRDVDLEIARGDDRRRRGEGRRPAQERADAG